MRMDFVAGIWFSLIAAQIALLLALVGFLIRFGILIISRGYDVPFVRTPRKYYPVIEEALQISPGDVVYDLGSGEGKFVLYLAKRHPDVRFIGIERNRLLCTQALLRKRFAGSPSNATFRRENFYMSDLSNATRIYAYLLSKVMTRLFAERTHPGLRIVSRAFKIKGREPLETITLSKREGFHGEHELHVYEL